MCWHGISKLQNIPFVWESIWVSKKFADIAAGNDRGTQEKNKMLTVAVYLVVVSVR